MYYLRDGLGSKKGCKQIGMVLAVLVSFRYRDSVYPLVFTWAYIAIALKQKDITSVYYTGIIIAIVLAIYAV